MRAAETILFEWHQLVVKKAPNAKNWGAYIQELGSSGADRNTLATLDQIRSLHRNPLMHPDIFLTVSESLRLFDIVKSAIVAMAEQVIALKPPSVPSL